jgi:hypothetical protein
MDQVFKFTDQARVNAMTMTDTTLQAFIWRQMPYLLGDLGRTRSLQLA